MIMRIQFNYIKNLFAVIVFTLSAATLTAQTLPSLTLNLDPAVVAQGSAGVASDAGAYSLKNNVAAMSLADETFAVQIGAGLWQPSYANYKAIDAGAMYRIGDKLGVGLDFNYLMMPEYSGITGGGSDIRDSAFSPNEISVALGASYAFIDFLSAGITLRYAGSSLAPEAKATVFGADLGIYFKKNGISAGLSVNNIGTTVKYTETAYPQPSMVKAGVGYVLGLGTSEIGFSAEADMMFAGGFMAGAGCEYSFKDLLFVRAGYHYGNSVNVVPSFASVGLGLKLFGAELNFAYILGSDILSNSMCISVGYSL